jgi:hypothetical protein
MATIEKQNDDELAQTALRVIRRLGQLGGTARERMTHHIRAGADLNGRYDAKIEDGLAELGAFLGDHRL